MAGHEAAGLPPMLRGRASSGLLGGRCEAFDGVRYALAAATTAGRCVCRVRLSPHRAQDTTTAFAQKADESNSLTSSPSAFRPGARAWRLCAAQAKARDAAPLCLPASHERRAGGWPSGASSDPRQPCAV